MKLARFPVHLGKGGTAHILPEFTGGIEWYEAYGKLHPDDGLDGRLISMHAFESDWDSWEVHPNGHEVVLCVSGRMTLVQEFPGGKVQKVTIGPGEYIINEPGVWHTADMVEAPAVAVFITAGEGTEHRPRPDR
ncbi:cupin domain-containing protein [Henriciella litoralis]|uniref:cupin domain-containing protein n=1 Tax=Henriciella litoralis TaxID=568102 RepID=UPI001F2AF53D|nr:cupin domain-containing protein [Henriciella litoralis]